MVNLHNQDREPPLKLGQRHGCMLLGIIVSSFLGIREGAAGQRVNLLVERAQQAFDMASKVGPRDRAPMQINAVFLTRHAQHLATELFGVVGVDRAHYPPDRPGRGHVVSGEPAILG